MANERLIDFGQKATPVAADILYLGDSEDAYNELYITIEQLIGVYPGLLSIGGVTIAANQMLYGTGANTYAATALTAAARTLLDDNTTADMLVTLGAYSSAGGVIGGDIDLNALYKCINAVDPTDAQDYATKNYVDNITQNVHVACYAATTADLAGYTYDNVATPPSGVGATLTAGSNGAFSVDGVSPAINSRIAVWQQSTQAQNGIYTLTQVGDGSNPAILTRATDYDEASDVQAGDRFSILFGTTLGGHQLQQTQTASINFGTTAITFSDTTNTGALLATNNLSDVSDVDTSRANLLCDDKLCQGRLTLTTGTPITTSSVSAAATLYFTPYKGNFIDLYDGSSTWDRIEFSEISIAAPAVATQMYDVFCYNNAGTATLELLAWTNDTTRATALTTQDGVYVKTGDTTRRYLGSVRTVAASQFNDTFGLRHVWNYYNRVSRPLKVGDNTNSWTWSTASWQQANANAANQLDIVVGVREDMIRINVSSIVASSTATTRLIKTGIGVDSTTVNSATVSDMSLCSGSLYATVKATFNDFPTTVGRHYYPWLEYGGGADTQTWYGDNGTDIQTGLVGYVYG